MEKITISERDSLTKFLKENIELKIAEQNLFESFPDKLKELGHIKLVISASEAVLSLKKTIAKLKRQVALLQEQNVEQMDIDTFKKYINS